MDCSEDEKKILDICSRYEPRCHLDQGIQRKNDLIKEWKPNEKIFFHEPDQIIFQAVANFEREYTRLSDSEFLDFGSEKSYFPQMIPKFLLTQNKIDSYRFYLNDQNEITLQRTTLVDLLVFKMIEHIRHKKKEVFICGPRGIGKSHAIAYLVLKYRMEELKQIQRIKVFYINNLKYFMEDLTIKYFLSEVVYFAGPNQKNISIDELKFTRSEFLKSQQDKKIMLQELFEKLFNHHENYNFKDVFDLLYALIEYFRRHDNCGFMLIVDQYNEKLVNGQEKKQIQFADLTTLFPFCLFGTSQMILTDKTVIRLNKRLDDDEAFRFIESRLFGGEFKKIKDSDIYQELKIKGETLQYCKQWKELENKIANLNDIDSEWKETLISDCMKIGEHIDELQKKKKELHLKKRSQSNQQINSNNTIVEGNKTENDKKGERQSQQKKKNIQKKASRQDDSESTEKNDSEEIRGITTRQQKKLKQTKDQPISKETITMPNFSKKSTSKPKLEIVDVTSEESKQFENEHVSEGEGQSKMRIKKSKPEFKIIDDEDLVLENNIVQNLTEYHPLDLHSLLGCVIDKGCWELGIEEFQVQKYMECQTLYEKDYPSSGNSEDRQAFFELVIQLSFDFNKKGIANIDFDNKKTLKNENFFYLNQEGKLEFSSPTIGNCLLQFLLSKYESFREILNGPGFCTKWKLCKEMEKLKFDQMRNDVASWGHALKKIINLSFLRLQNQSKLKIIVELSFLRLQNQAKLKTNKSPKFINFKVKGINQNSLKIPKNFDVIYFDYHFILPKSQNKELSMTIFTPKSLRFDHVDFILFLYSRDHQEFLFIQVSDNIYSHKTSDISVKELMMKPGTDSFSKALQTYKDIDHKFIWLGRYNAGISEDKYRDAIWNKVDENSLVLEADDFIDVMEKIINLY